MQYKLIKNDVYDVVTPEEKAQIELNQRRLEKSNFLLPIPLKDFFDVFLYNKLMEERLRDGLYAARLDMALSGKTDAQILTMHKHMIAKQLTLNFNLQDALQKELKDLGYNFNVEQKTKELIDALRKERKYAGTRRKLLADGLATKQSILEEIKEITGGGEPTC